MSEGKYNTGFETDEGDNKTNYSEKPPLEGVYDNIPLFIYWIYIYLLLFPLHVCICMKYLKIRLRARTLQTFFHNCNGFFNSFIYVQLFPWYFCS